MAAGSLKHSTCTHVCCGLYLFVIGGVSFITYIHCTSACTYSIAGKFHWVQFLQMVDLYHFTGLIFADVRTHTHYVLYNRAYFAGFNFHG